MLMTTIHASVYYGLNSNVVMIDKIGIEYPDIARAVYRSFEGKSDEEVRQLMAADLVLQHLDSIMMQKANMPHEHFVLWRNSAELMLKHMPVLHDWIGATPEVCSQGLREMAERCRPAIDREAT